MIKLPVIIHQLREEYIQTGRAKTYQEINCGECVDFAEDIEHLSSYTAETLSNDNFVNVGGEGWNGDKNDIWSEEWLAEFNSLPPRDITIPELTHKISGYHCWIYSNGKHCDSECKEGVENLFDLPFFIRHLTHQEEKS